MARIAKRDLTRQQQLARGPVDLPFLALVLLLGIGLVMLLSASSYTASVEKVSNYDAAFYFKRQAAFAVMGLVIMYVASKFDYQWLRGISPFIMLAAILLLTAVLVIGSTSNQATRWLELGPLRFQPSEVAKVGVVLFFSACLCKRDQSGEHKLKGRYREPIQSLRKFWYWSDLHDIWYLVLILVVLVVLLILEPHLSGTILICAAAAAVFFAAGVKLFWFILGGGLGVVGVWILLVVVGYNGERLQTRRNPWWDAGDKSYQICLLYISDAADE